MISAPSKKAYEVLEENWNPDKWTDKQFIESDLRGNVTRMCVKGALAYFTGHNPNWKPNENGNRLIDETDFIAIDEHVLNSFPGMTRGQLSDIEDISDSLGPLEALNYLREKNL